MNIEANVYTVSQRRWAGGKFLPENQTVTALSDFVETAALSHPHLYPDGHVEYVTYNTSGSVGFQTGKHELLPFPATEMSVNPNMKQNPGW